MEREPSAKQLRRALSTALTDGQQGFSYFNGELTCTIFRGGSASVRVALDDAVTWLVEDADGAMAAFPEQSSVRAVLSLASVNIEEDLDTGRNPFHCLRSDWVLIRKT